MSLARRAVLAASRTRPAVFATQCRAASSSHGHHDEHHEHHEEDSTVYPREGFGNSFWAKVVLVSALGVAAVKLSPVASDDVYLSRWIALYTAPGDYWLGLNAKHTTQQQDCADEVLLLNSAHQHPIHRFRYPQSLTQGSPFLVMVGSEVDMSGVVVKGEKDV